MSCDKFHELLVRECVGALTLEDSRSLDSHLAGCETCRKERESLHELWAGLSRIPSPEPSPQLRQRFYAMLDDHRDAQERSPRLTVGRSLLFGLLHPWMRPAMQFGVGILLVVLGGIAGYWMRSDKKGHEEITDLREEVHETRRMLAVSLMNQSSAGERLKGVSWSSRVATPDREFLEALYHTLNSDPNVNVRLAAMDALARFTDNPDVREKLIGSLSGQDSPLVQIMLIGVLVQLNERQSVEALQGVLRDETQSPQVRERAQWGLRQLL